MCVDVGVAGICTVIVCEAHRHVNHANTRGSGGMPPGNFEKLCFLRLNLRAFLVIYHPLMFLWTQVYKTFYNVALPACHPCSFSAIVYLNICAITCYGY